MILSTLPYKDILALSRPKHWIKNLFVFAPLIFAGEFLDMAFIEQTLVAFLYFSLASSSVYIVNDICDIEYDKLHPIKSKERPLASGRIKKNQAFLILMVYYMLLSSSFFFNELLAVVILSYLVINIAYSINLKSQPVLELFIVSMGFVLRVYGGAVVIDVPVSPWMFVTTLSLALYLVSIKRLQELKSGDINGRAVLKKYNAHLMERYAEISAISSLLFYSLFVITESPQMSITIPFVIYGLFRYWFLVENLNKGESPTDTLLEDWQMLITTVLWLLVCIWALYPSL
jgi:4-hydroxybenzoate polyprenyltransferase